MSCNHVHPTREAVYDATVAEMPPLALRTIYQPLNDLTDMGEIQARDLGTGWARFDPNVYDHHDLVCEVCGWVAVVYLDASGIDLSRRQLVGFEMDGVDIVFRGRCARCR